MLMFVVYCGGESRRRCLWCIVEENLDVGACMRSIVGENLIVKCQSKWALCVHTFQKFLLSIHVTRSIQWWRQDVLLRFTGNRPFFDLTDRNLWLSKDQRIQISEMAWRAPGIWGLTRLLVAAMLPSVPTVIKTRTTSKELMTILDSFSRDSDI